MQWNASRLAQRKVDELLGICSGIAADGVVNQDEAQFLASWLEANREAAACFPGDILIDRLHDMLVDGVLDEEEAAELLQTLRSSCGMSGTVEVPAPAAPQLLDADPAPVVFAGRKFVLTGIFAYGPRKACEQATVDRGGRVHPRVTGDVDYVVIGSAASPDWKHASYGTKIASALELKEAGNPIAIISEDHWAEAVVTTPDAARPAMPTEGTEPENSLEGKRVLFTGYLNGISRDIAQTWVEQRGGRVVSSVSTKLDYLVYGDEPSTKLDKARSLGITILDQAAFQQLIGRDASTIEESKERGTEDDWYLDILLNESSKPETTDPQQALQIKEIPGIAGKHFTLTGYTYKIGRKEAEKLIRQAGGIVTYSVTKSRTDYVVSNQISRTESNRAAKWGKPIIGGKELLEMLQGKS